MAEHEKLDKTAETTAKKAEKAEKKKNPKPSLLARVKRWIRELRSELKKVQWPTAQQTFKNTMIVIACVLIVGVFIWVFDFIAAGLIQALISLFH